MTADVAAAAHKYRVVADHNDVFPADHDLFASAKEAAEAVPAEDNDTHEKTRAAINLNVGHVSDTAAVLDVDDFLFSKIGHGTIQNLHAFHRKFKKTIYIFPWFMYNIFMN